MQERSKDKTKQLATTTFNILFLTCWAIYSWNIFKDFKLSQVATLTKINKELSFHVLDGSTPPSSIDIGLTFFDSLGSHSFSSKGLSNNELRNLLRITEQIESLANSFSNDAKRPKARLKITYSNNPGISVNLQPTTEEQNLKFNNLKTIILINKDIKYTHLK